MELLSSSNNSFDWWFLPKGLLFLLLLLLALLIRLLLFLWAFWFPLDSGFRASAAAGWSTKGFLKTCWSCIRHLWKNRRRDGDYFYGTTDTNSYLSSFLSLLDSCRSNISCIPSSSLWKRLPLAPPPLRFPFVQPREYWKVCPMHAMENNNNNNTIRNIEEWKFCPIYAIEMIRKLVTDGSV